MRELNFGRDSLPRRIRMALDEVAEDIHGDRDPNQAPRKMPIGKAFGKNRGRALDFDRQFYPTNHCGGLGLFLPEAGSSEDTIIDLIDAVREQRADAAVRSIKDRLRRSHKTTLTMSPAAAKPVSSEMLLGPQRLLDDPAKPWDPMRRLTERTR